MATTWTGSIWIKADAEAQPLSKTLLACSLLYAVSLVKFFVRDPLAAETGPQGPIELVLVVAACAVILPSLVRLNWKPFVPPCAWAFLSFGVLASASSVFSYYPLLSFIKTIVFLLVLVTAIVATSAFGPAKVIKYLYYAIIGILVTGLILKLVVHEPLFLVDEYSGRARFTMFAWAPGTLGDLCALTLLAGTIIPERPRLYFQLFLLVINIGTTARTSSGILIVVLLLFACKAIRLTPRFLFLSGCIGLVLTSLLWFGLLRQQQMSRPIISATEDLYGDSLNEDIATFNGRTEVWRAAWPVLLRSSLLGYGFDGSRDVLVKNTSWDAGNTHNALIDLILAAGVPATLIYLLGWAGAVKRAWLTPGFLGTGALGMYFYIAGFGMTSPNLTYLQGLASFLIIAIDAMVCAELS